VNAIATTAVTGNLVQSGTGRLLMDFDHATATSDRINVSGGTAALSGAVQINQLNVTAIRPGTSQVVLVSAPQGLTTSGLSLDIAPSAVQQYQLVTLPTNLSLTLTTNFAPTGSAAQVLTPNERQIGEYINEVQKAGSSQALAQTILQVMSLENVTQLQAAYQHLNPESYAAPQLAAVQSGLQFSDALLSCKSRDGAYRFVRESECGWMSLYAGSQDYDATVSANGYSREVNTIGGGAQWALDSRWHVGLAATYDSDRILADTFKGEEILAAKGNTVHAGAVVKGNFGDNTFSLSLSAGRGEYDTQRRALLSYGATSEQTIFQSALQLRLGHAFTGDRWYWRPTVDLGVTNVHRNAFDESGAGANDLQVKADSDTFVDLRPALEAGYDIAMGSSLARFYIRAGVTRFVSGGDVGVEASLAGAPNAAGSFSVEQTMDRSIRDLALGVDLFGNDGAVVRLGYSGQFSSGSSAHGGSMKISLPF
jgi:outer membrane autotransporter protein